MSGVRGPTSALTEFLRERGITARNTNRFRRRDSDQAADQGQQQEQQQPQQQQDGSVQRSQQGGQSSAEASGAASPAVKKSASGSSSPATTARRRAAAGSSMRFDEDEDSDDDDDDDGDDTDAYKGPVAGPSGAAKRGAPSGLTRALRKRSKNDDDEYEPPVDLPTPSSARIAPTRSSRAPGSISHCGMCQVKFTVTRYTKMAPSGPFCHRCGPLYKGEPADGNPDQLASPMAPKKRQARRKVQDILQAGHKVMPTLQGFCINIISHYIEEMEVLGDIGLKNLDAISKSISKNRSLNPRTLQLFLYPDIATLSLYDCSKLDSESLQTIPTFAPNLVHINLQLCGQLDNAAIDTWAVRLQQLRGVELYGPYLVRKEAWHRFFNVLGGRLESFKIRESPRFDIGCARQMVEHCPNVKELGLAQIGPLDDAMLKPLEAFTSLTYLDISDPGVSAPGIPPKSLQDRGVVSLLKAVGRHLTYLDVSKNADLTDLTVVEGVLPNCRRLHTLRMVGLEKISPEAMLKVFEQDPTTTAMAKEEKNEDGEAYGFSRLCLDRMLQVDDGVLLAILKHSGPFLVELGLNSIDRISGEALKRIGESCPNLEKLDVGFCREVDDSVIEAICEGCKKLKVVYVFGCNRITDFAKSDRVKIVGKERYSM